VVWEQAHRPSAAGAQFEELSAGFVTVQTSAKEAPRVFCGACRIPANTE
jgi:hypothetical protein